MAKCRDEQVPVNDDAGAIHVRSNHSSKTLAGQARTPGQGPLRVVHAIDYDGDGGTAIDVVADPAH